MYIIHWQYIILKITKSKYNCLFSLYFQIENHMSINMELKPEALREHGFILLDSLDHQQLIPFVQKYLKKSTSISWIDQGINIFFVSFIVCLIWKSVYIENIKFVDCFSYLSFGTLFVFLLMPVHEYIFFLAYKSQGTQHTS